MHEESMAKLEIKAAEAELLQAQLHQASEALSLSEVPPPHRCKATWKSLMTRGRST